jgi:hypothetical protein
MSAVTRILGTSRSGGVRAGRGLTFAVCEVDDLGVQAVHPEFGGLVYAVGHGLPEDTAVQQWVSEMTTGGDERKPKAAATVIRNYGVPATILDDAVGDRRLLSNPA